MKHTTISNSLNLDNPIIRKENYNLNYLRNGSNNTIYECASEHSHNLKQTLKKDKKTIENEVSPTNKGSNIQMKNLNLNMNKLTNQKGLVDNVRLNQSIDNNICFNTKSISFREDDNFVYKSKSTFSDGDIDNNYNFSNYFDKQELVNKLSGYVNILKESREANIKKYTDDNSVIRQCQELFQANKNNTKRDNEKNSKHDIQIVINYLYNKNIDDNLLFLCLVKLINLFEYTNKNTLIEYFFKNYGLINFLNFLHKNLHALSGKNLHLILHVLNQMISENNNIIEDLIVYQLYFYMTRLIHLYPDIEIKEELIYLVYQIVFMSPGLMKIFLGSGGFFLLPNLIDSALMKTNDSVGLILLIGFFLMIFERSKLNFDEIALIFINNKVLTRLNIILFDIFADETNLDNQNIVILLESIIELLVKFSEVHKI